MNALRLLGIILALIFGLQAEGQDSMLARQHKITINGYIKNLGSLMFSKDFNSMASENLIHNRLNLKWKPIGKLTAVMELRNRLIWGDVVQNDSIFRTSLRNENEWADLQKLWLTNSDLALHTNVERLYLEFTDAKWNVRVGRQRINWGVTTTWNPNDIFNAYNFLDFDYEERPGADGARAKYLFNDFTNLEMAYANTGKESGSIAALRFSMNRWKYDLHFIGGWYKTGPTFGAGWAGNIKDAGFKGEMQYCLPASDSPVHVNISMEVDYMFKKGWYVNVGGLYNNYGIDKAVNNWAEISLEASPMNLMPTKWNLISTVSKEFTPLLSGSVALVYAPGVNLVIVVPALQYSLATNLDVNLIWQPYFSELQNEFQAVNHIVFLRFKWSF